MMSGEMFSLAGYEVVALIGQGGLGDVYEARQLSTGATVAIKILREAAGEPASLHRLQREMEALAALGGQGNVIRLLDVVESDAGPALVMEFAPGGSVAQLVIQRERVLSTDEVAFIGEQVASALAAAHQHGIIHRDVKPQNLLIDAYGAVKLCDFGIAAITRSEKFQTRTTALSVRYASPEDLEQDADVGEASDVYSLGATLLHLAHGAPPTLRERVQAWVPPGRLDPIDNDLDEVIAACLQPDPASRPSAVEVAHRLDELGARISPRRRSLSADSPQSNLVESNPALPTIPGPEAYELQPHPAPGIQSAPVVSPPPGPTNDSDTEFDIDSLAHPTSSSSPDRDEDPDLARLPRPTFQSERRTRLVSQVVTTLSIVMVAVLIGTLGWRLFLRGDASNPQTDATEKRTLIARDDGDVSLKDKAFPTVAVGQCLGVEVGGIQAQVVSCADVHDGEVLAVERVPANLDGPFDAQKVDSFADDFCDGIDTPTVQDSLEPADPKTQLDLKLLVVSPTAESWDQGDRRVMCVLAAPNARIAGVTS